MRCTWEKKKSVTVIGGNSVYEDVVRGVCVCVEGLSLSFWIGEGEKKKTTHQDIWKSLSKS